MAHDLSAAPKPPKPPRRRVFSPAIGRLTLFLCLGFACVLGAKPCHSQSPNTKRMVQQREAQRANEMRAKQQRIKQATASAPAVPTDPKLLSLHKEFITKAQKLAGEYERKKQLDRAREVYQSVVRLVPGYQDAESALERILQMQSMKDRKIVKVNAALGWQDSGIKLEKGMPVHTEVKGTWSIVLETGPDGVQIPESSRLRDPRIKLGTLLGAIVTSESELKKVQPFVVKPGDDFVVKESGRLFFSVYDVDPSDNRGEMMVMVQSSFSK